MQDSFRKGYAAQEIKQASPADRAKVQKEIDQKTADLGMKRLKKDIVIFAKENNTKVINKALMVNFMKSQGFDDNVIAKISNKRTNIEDPVAIETRLRAAMTASKKAAEPEVVAPKEPTAKPAVEQPKEPEAVEPQNAANIVQLINALPREEKEKFTQHFFKALGAR